MTPDGSAEAPLGGAAAPGAPAERRRVERRGNARVADLSLPEFRRIVVTSILSALVVLLFVWMVRGVLIAAILGVVIAAYLRPFYFWILGWARSRRLAALLTIVAVLLPVVATLAWSYYEIVGVAQYLEQHQHEVARRIDAAVSRLVFLKNANTSEMVERWVVAASAYGTAIPGLLRRTIVRVSSP